ncbi:GrpB family protein [Paenibacillus sp. LMG 31456]|uniref:GrpB family protein n=1 Tax=Paenibacillus foliorum TaxID=2654974 RepID=A0A972GUW7_9BACL|nr:GrpB family protein [Paenibacillus foliorum]NOU93270.1 GrpB family protein [Paenibacillus foliorum]
MLGLPKGQVFLVPWTEKWIQEYEFEREKINKKLTKLNVRMHHIGSTSIKGISAKPIIDMAIEINHFDDGLLYVAGLEELGYSYHGINLLPERHYFNKGEPRTHQIHMYEKNNRYLKEQLLFRDYLNSDKISRQEYQELKEELSKTFNTNKHAYAEAKTEFVKNIILKANLKG